MPSLPRGSMGAGRGVAVGADANKTAGKKRREKNGEKKKTHLLTLRLPVGTVAPVRRLERRRIELQAHLEGNQTVHGGHPHGHGVPGRRRRRREVRAGLGTQVHIQRPGVQVGEDGLLRGRRGGGVALVQMGRRSSQ
eukprot:1185592-Prorocentrum_minimum.AAC.2